MPDDDAEKLRQDLARYRNLLRATTDPAAIAALGSMIAEIEAALQRPRPGRDADPDRG